MKVYLAGTYSRPYCLELIQCLKEGGGDNELMKIYLAGEHTVKNGKLADWSNVNILESYFYAKKNQNICRLISCKGCNFLLDSGAFTFMQNQKAGLNWDNYIAEYCEFITYNKVKSFFELDIDSVVGLKKVERLRAKIEQLTGMQPIPVWHKSRGLDYWRGMAKDYQYIAIGGIVTREIKLNEHPIFTNLIGIAKDAGSNVHGLGYTNLKGLEKYKFDSVDSTSWLFGNRKGSVFKFNGKTIIDIQKPAGTRLISQEVALNNFREWVKFQKYAEQNL